MHITGWHIEMSLQGLIRASRASPLAQNRILNVAATERAHSPSNNKINGNPYACVDIHVKT